MRKRPRILLLWKKSLFTPPEGLIHREHATTLTVAAISRTAKSKSMNDKPSNAGSCPVLFAYRSDRKTCRICVPKKKTARRRSTANAFLKLRMVQNATALLKRTDAIVSCTNLGKKSNENKRHKKALRAMLSGL